MHPRLRLDLQEVARHGPGNLLAVCWRQWRTERALAARGVLFRTTDPAAVEAAYAAMSEEEFESINARQAWANWRTIPRSLDGNLPDRPLRVVDLGCGTGPSTSVLAFCCPPGSTITGYELAEPLTRVARRRPYPGRTGRPAAVDFVCQGVTEPLRDPSGGLLPAGSVDLANASGVVGHHLTAVTVGPLLAELGRVLAPEGCAALDVGPTLAAAELTALMTSAGFRALGRHSSCFVDRGGQVVFRRL